MSDGDHGPHPAGAWWRAAPTTWVALAVVLVVTAVVFLPSLEGGFTNWDDPQYVTDNEALRSVSTRGYSQAIHRVIGGNYHPLTMLTLAWDHQRSRSETSPRGGLAARPFHATSLALHVANTALVFLLAYLLADRRPVVATVTAALFGVHPMHVESVAWIAARKDVLYAFFFLLALLFYVEYRRGDRIWAYVACLATFACSLLAKSAAVVLPVALLLVDHLLDGGVRRRSWLDKIPFLAGSIAMGLVTLRLQSASGAVGEISYGFLERCVVAGYAFTSYLIKLFLPMNLSAMYPFPPRLTAAHFVMAVIAVAIATVAVACHRRHRVVFFGIAFFAVNVALVLQFLPVGSVIIADRYTYVSAIGIFFLAGVGLDRIIERSPPMLRILAVSLAMTGVLTAAYVGRDRIDVWKDTHALWSDVISKYPDTAYKAYASRGAYLRGRNDLEAALADLDRAIEIAPGYPKTYLTRANAYRDLARDRGDTALLSRSIEDVDTALSLDPRDADLHHARALAHSYLRRADAALEDFAAALRLDPTLTGAYRDRARLYLALGRLEPAYEDYTAYLRYRPNDPVVLLLRADTAVGLDRLADAEADFTRCVKSAPQFGDCYLGRARVLERLGRNAEASKDLERSRRLAEPAPP